VLWGSRTEYDFEVEDDFAIHTAATPESLLLTMRGVEDSETHQRRLSTQQLRGYSEDIDVLASNGRNYTVHLDSMCVEAQSE
jgi:hypothetical protein